VESRHPVGREGEGMRYVGLTEEEYRHLLGFLEMMLDEQSYLGHKYVSEAPSNRRKTQLETLKVLQFRLQDTGFTYRRQS
jgi:hypothetical protein